MRTIIVNIRRGGGRTASYSLAVFFAFMVVQAASAATINYFWKLGMQLTQPTTTC